MSETSVFSPEPGPHTLIEVRWGGQRLAPLRGADAGRPIGESWEFSTLEGRESRTRGQPLPAVLGRSLPFLAKLIDTRLPLSVQVHPRDDPAKSRLGKEEAWVVLDADRDAFVRVGIRAGLAQAELSRIARDVAENRVAGDRLLDCLNLGPVRAGSVVLVPAGTLHAIGGGILLAEIQQPTDCTYRLFDYGSGRELHVDDALEAADVHAQPQLWSPDETPCTLRGQHLELRILGAGSYHIRERRDWLVIPVLGGTRLTAGEHDARLAPAQLRLCAGGPPQVEVEPGGAAVLGSLP